MTAMMTVAWLHPRQRHQRLVYLVGDKHEESEQRMAVDVIAGAPMGDDHVGDRVEPRDLKLEEQLAVIVAQRKNWLP